MKKKRLSEKQRDIVLSIVGLLISAAFLFPLYWIIVNSFKTDGEIFRTPPTLFPSQPTFEPYMSQVMGEYNIYHSLLNSIFIATSSALISMLLAFPAAYGLARFRIKGRRLFIKIFLITQMLPVTLILTPMFIVYKNIGIYNTYFAPILSDCTLAIPFVVLILRTYFLGLPKEIEDSAKIDGCNNFTAFVKVMLPMSYPGLIMAGAFSFLFAWGDLVFALTFLNSQSMRPMTAGIYNFIGRYGIQWNKIMAFSTLVILPVILIFIFLQKYIIGGLTSGAVKE
jgi:multiple sugar transport system permease protein